jgi:hypothetical protein
MGDFSHWPPIVVDRRIGPNSGNRLLSSLGGRIPSQFTLPFLSVQDILSPLVSQWPFFGHNYVKDEATETSQKLLNEFKSILTASSSLQSYGQKSATVMKRRRWNDQFPDLYVCVCLLLNMANRLSAVLLGLLSICQRLLAMILVEEWRKYLDR